MSQASQAIPSSELPRAGRTGFALSPKQAWGLLFVAPYLVIFVASVVFPVGYAFWLARDPQLYVDLVHDPVFLRTAVNTLVFLIVAINVKMVIALFLSGFFTHKRWWVKVLAVLFVLPWAVPSIPTIISVRFMLNPEWGVINQLIFQLTADDGPNWLNDPTQGDVLLLSEPVTVVVD